MTKISADGIKAPRSLESESNPKAEQARKSESLDRSDDSVISKLRPELPDSNQAQAAVDSLKALLSQDGEKALDAAGSLNESRIMDLLSDD